MFTPMSATPALLMTLLPPPRQRLCDHVGLFVILSVCVQPHATSYALIYKKCLPKVGLAQSQGGFILEVVWIDLHRHLEVTVAQQGHFGIKSTVVQKR